MSFPAFAFSFVVGFGSVTLILMALNTTIVHAFRHGYYGDFARYHAGKAGPVWWAWKAGAWWRPHHDRLMAGRRARAEERAIRRREWRPPAMSNDASPAMCFACRAGAHERCDGDAWSPAARSVADCPCGVCYGVRDA